MLFGCFDEKDLWITELDRIIMFKAMVDHGFSLEDYRFDMGGYQDNDSSETFKECLSVFCEHHAVDMEEEDKEYCIRLKFHFDEQCVWGHERGKLEGLKEELKESMQSIDSDCVHSSWEDDYTLKVDLEGGQDHGSALYKFLTTFNKIRPYMEVRIENVSDHHTIGTIITTY